MLSFEYGFRIEISAGNDGSRTDRGYRFRRDARNIRELPHPGQFTPGDGCDAHRLWMAPRTASGSAV